MFSSMNTTNIGSTVGTFGGIKVGAFPDETASIAYDGTLLPAGTAKYGSELVVNGGFDTDTNWTKTTGWTISGGVLNANVGNYISAYQMCSFYANSYYIVTYTVTITSGSCRVYFSGGTNAIGTERTTTGTFTEIIKANTGNNTLSISSIAIGFVGSIDNVSVKEVLINPNTRYLKDLGKDKNHILVESGQGKFFNGSNQYFNSLIIPNQAQGTLVTRFTYASGTDRLVIGQSGGTSNFMVGVNTSGKLYSRLGASSNVATSWSPIAGKSYHVSIRYSGGVAELIVDTISIGTFTIDASLPTVGLSIGARNTSTTPSLFWNSVIDETYYYDIALTDAQISTLYQYPEKIKAYNGAIVPDIGNEDNCKLFLPISESNNTLAHVYNVAVTPATQMPIASFTASCVDSAKQLSYGAQCIAWKRDALGLPIGMSGGLSFDGGKSVKGASTGWTPNPAEPFVVEAIIKRLGGVASQIFGCSDTATGRLGLGLSGGVTAQTNLGNIYPVTTVTTDYIHLVIVYSGIIGQSKVFINGVENTAYTKETSFTTPTTPFYVGSLGTTQKQIFIGTNKIHKGTQYAKFNIAKSWKNAQKIIAKLGA